MKNQLSFGKPFVSTICIKGAPGFQFLEWCFPFLRFYFPGFGFSVPMVFPVPVGVFSFHPLGFVVPIVVFSVTTWVFKVPELVFVLPAGVSGS